MEATNPTMTATVSAPSAMPTASAQPSAVNQPMNQASPSQVSAPTMTPAAAPQVSAPAGNPWQQAFQALSASLNTASPSQAPAAYSAYQTPTPQAATQANWGSTAYSAAPTYAPQASTQEQTYSKQTVLALLAAQRKETLAQVAAQQESQSDAYLSGISNESLEVLEHFGAEAPVLLNQYACAVEDALIEQVQRCQSMAVMLPSRWRRARCYEPDAHRS